MYVYMSRVCVCVCVKIAKNDNDETRLDARTSRKGEVCEGKKTQDERESETLSGKLKVRHCVSGIVR